ncbi:thioesterase family protein [Rhodanobacter sp. AS-Z3]|uniref:acyl-CoA thioesterase n=1 Tax=Rhodanobacter sp. AS-Z3 TaxID=3031330 RepID=UPI0024797932|nr:thioesterase family protein [Rhodanobacter sp. AS-Z3]WEN16373.1 thioesterase family protein [Rhodanobacter sp. AS-Z3]
MRFSEAMHSVTRHGDGWRASVSEDWLQGRSAFGGLQAALALRAMRDLVPADMPLRSLQTTFVAPVPAGTVSIRAQCLRQGRSAIQVEASLCDGDQTLCRLIGVFGNARPSALDFQPVQAPVENAAAPELRYSEGRMPAFTQHFAARWLRGDLPFSGGQQRESVLQLSLRDEGPVDETHVLAFADFIPPIALSMFAAPTPGSSLSWMIELLRDRYDDLGTDNWRVDAELIAARDGYTHQSVMLWGPRGEAVALSRQSMVVFG